MIIFKLCYICPKTTSLILIEIDQPQKSETFLIIDFNILNTTTLLKLTPTTGSTELPLPVLTGEKGGKVRKASI